MRGFIAAIAVAASAATCANDINTYAGANLQLQYPIQWAWKPFFNAYANNTQFGQLTTQCPRITRSMVLSDNSGNQLMRLEGQITLFGALTGTWSSTKVFDCADNYIARIDASFLDAFVNQFGFSSSYSIVAPNGTTIGTATADYVQSTLQVTTASMGNLVTGRASWRWRIMSVFENDYGININQFTPNTASPGEVMVALTSLGYLRYVTSSKGSSASTDECSRFVITGVPVLGVMWICVSCCLIVLLDNKLVAILFSLFLPIFVALFLALAAVAGVISLLLLILKLLMNCCCRKAVEGFEPLLPLVVVVGVFAAAAEWVLSVGGSSGKRASSLRSWSQRNRGMRSRSSRQTSSDATTSPSNTAADALITQPSSTTTPAGSAASASGAPPTRAELEADLAVITARVDFDAVPSTVVAGAETTGTK